MEPISTGGIAVSASQLAARPRRGKALGLVAAAILGIAIISQPTLAHAAHGGGGFHGGGFHGGGFHGGGFHRGEFHGGYRGWRAFPRRGISSGRVSRRISWLACQRLRLVGLGLHSPAFGYWR